MVVGHLSLVARDKKTDLRSQCPSAGMCRSSLRTRSFAIVLWVPSSVLAGTLDRRFTAAVKWSTSTSNIVSTATFFRFKQKDESGRCAISYTKMNLSQKSISRDTGNGLRFMLGCSLTSAFSFRPLRWLHGPHFLRCPFHIFKMLFQLTA